MAWYCTVCQLEVDLSDKEAHLIGLGHKWKLHKMDPSTDRAGFIDATDMSSNVEVAEAELIVRDKDPQSRADEKPLPVNSRTVFSQSSVNDKHNAPEVEEEIPFSMSWKCDTCDETMNIFSRYDHLRGKAHNRRTRVLAQSETGENSSERSISSLWVCKTCDETMNIFYKQEHLRGKGHATMLLARGKDFIAGDNDEGNELSSTELSEYRTLDESCMESELGDMRRLGFPQSPQSTYDYCRSEVSSHSSKLPKAKIIFNDTSCHVGFIENENGIQLSIDWECEVCRTWLAHWRDHHLDPHEQQSQRSGEANKTTAVGGNAAAEPRSATPQTNHQLADQGIGDRYLLQPTQLGVAPEKIDDDGTGDLLGDIPTAQLQQLSQWTSQPPVDTRESIVIQNTPVKIAEEIYLLGDIEAPKHSPVLPEIDDPTNTEHPCLDDKSLEMQEPDVFRCSYCGDIEYGIELRKFHIGHSWECTICERAMHPSSVASHLAGARHKARELLKQTDAPSTARVAPRIAPVSSRAKSAVIVEAIKRIVSETPPEASIPFASDTFHCESCKVTLDVKEERLHRGPAWECPVCKITTHVGRKERHLSGRKHRQKVQLQRAMDNCEITG